MPTDDKAAVFFDRDGVINRTVFRRGAQRAPQDMSEWAYMEGVEATVRELHARGYKLFVVTNQPDVSRGWQSREQVDAFHAMLERELPFERVYACFHDNSDACACRKPKPGMLHAARDEFGVDLSRSFMIGDRQGDIDAGKAAGVTTIHMHHEGEAAAEGADHVVTRVAAMLDLLP